MNRLSWMIGCGLIAILLVANAKAGLPGDLLALDQLRQGDKTRFDLVEARGKELLERYTAPEDQARIYFQLAHIHTQSGMQNPVRILTYCNEALRRPLLSADRLRLYVYAGDAHQVMDKMHSDKEKRPFRQVRRHAAAMYLRGLAESQKLNLPDKKPEWVPRTSGFGPLVTSKRLDDPQVKQEQARRQKENEKYEQERTKFRHDEKAWEYRQILFDQIIEMYWRSPLDRDYDEMQKLASEALSPEMVAKLFERKKELLPKLEAIYAPAKKP